MQITRETVYPRVEQYLTNGPRYNVYGTLRAERESNLPLRARRAKPIFAGFKRRRESRRQLRKSGKRKIRCIYNRGYYLVVGSVATEHDYAMVIVMSCR